MDDESPPNLGDLIESREEVGVVCNLDPPVLRTIGVTSYVIYNPAAYRMLQREAEPEVVPAKPEVVQRIRDYIASRDLPTGVA